MRSLYFLLLITTSFLVSLVLSTEAVSTTRTANAVENNKVNNRFLRDASATEVQTGEENEDRATITLGENLVSNKAATKALLQKLLAENTPINKVSEKFLGIPPTISFAELIKHPNWRALDKYERMMWQKQNEGKTLAYALIGGKLYSKEQAQEQLLMRLVQKKPLQSVHDELQVGGLALNTNAARQNWRAMSMYEKWFAAAPLKTNSQQYAKFGTGYHTEQKTSEQFNQWAMQGYPIKDAVKSLNLKGKSASDMAAHENFPALLKYVKMYLDYKPIRDLHAANVKKLARERRPIS